MQAVTVPEPGGPEALVWAEVADPVPGPGEVLVEVAASAVNRADLLQREGRYPPPAGAPPYPGLECSGWVGSLGPGVTGWRPGDAVVALLAGGGYAERVCVPAGQLLPVPAGVDLVPAAGLAEVACTVHSTVVERAGLRTGETLLVHGGSGGVGTFAVQLGRALGADVLTTARPATHDRLRRLGARVCFDYAGEDFVAGARAATDGRGVDVVLDNMGAAYLGRNLEALAPDGRLVVIGLQGGRRGELDLGALLARRVTLYASTLRARPAEQKARIVAAVGEQVWPMLADGRIVPVVAATVPMAEAGAAHRLLEAGGVVGKVLLVTAAGAARRMGG